MNIKIGWMNGTSGIAKTKCSFFFLRLTDEHFVLLSKPEIIKPGQQDEETPAEEFVKQEMASNKSAKVGVLLSFVFVVVPTRGQISHFCPEKFYKYKAWCLGCEYTHSDILV